MTVFAEFIDKGEIPCYIVINISVNEIDFTMVDRNASHVDWLVPGKGVIAETACCCEVGSRIGNTCITGS